MPHAQQSTKATSCIVTSSESSGNSTTHLTALLPFKDMLSQAHCIEVRCQAKKKPSTRHRPGIGCGRSSGLRSCMIAALGLCQFQVLAHPTLKPTSTEHEIVAGNGGDFNEEMVVDPPTKVALQSVAFPHNASAAEDIPAKIFVVTRRTRWECTILFLTMIALWVSCCWEVGVDRAQF